MDVSILIIHLHPSQLSLNHTHWNRAGDGRWELTVGGRQGGGQAGGLGWAAGQAGVQAGGRAEAAEGPELTDRVLAAGEVDPQGKVAIAAWGACWRGGR